jgi:hypothetical protein
MSNKQRDEAKAYFFERYKDASFTVVPEHWPDFQTKEEVDEYIDTTEKIMEAFRK